MPTADLRTFDARHTISANAVVQLPVGKGKALLGHIPTWLDYAIGGWQVSTLFTFRTGLPLTCTDSGVYNVNYDNSAYCVVKPGWHAAIQRLHRSTAAASPASSPTRAPSIPVVASNPGQVGTRGMFRGNKLWNDDLSVSKTIKLPFEGHRLQLRAEAYNMLNHENFGNPSLNMASPTTFGEITSTATGAAARVMQFAARYEF